MTRINIKEQIAQNQLLINMTRINFKEQTAENQQPEFIFTLYGFHTAFTLAE